MFHPNMSASTEGFVPIGEVRCRAWQGVLADLWEVEGQGGATGEYVADHPRLFAVLEPIGNAAITISEHPDDAASFDIAPQRLSFIPAGMRTWSALRESSRLRHLDLHFDLAALAARFAGGLDSQQLAVPRLMFDDERVLTLARLLARECEGPALHDLYGDGLALALFTALFAVPPPPARAYRQLSPRRLRAATDYLTAHCLRAIKLQELAELVGLSQSYFSSAFKASTGLAPHQWQTRARVEQVKTMLLAPDMSLTDVAMAAGFADQAHMTRVFKQSAGVTPAAWVRANGTVRSISAGSFNRAKR